MPDWYLLQPSRASSSLEVFSNDLFPQAWMTHARFRRVGLKIRAEAGVLLKVFRHRKEAAQELILEQLSEQAETVFALPPLIECGERLSYRLYAGTQEIAFQSKEVVADWVCDCPPEHQVGIMIVVCTRNRDRQLQTLVDQLTPQMRDVKGCIIVNQGKTALQERLILRSDKEKYQIFEQKNFGGAGGFTRGIIESLKNEDVTHVLLIDDDVELDSGLLCRLSFALSYISPNTCIGGAMTDISQRDRFLSIGHIFDSVRSMTTDLLSHVEIHSSLVQAKEVDFCGWWCFCFPRAAAEVCGLPLPLFLRGDDAEYGLRLRRLGFQTVMWPGINVAHPDLGNQTRPWHHYYDRRNALFCTEFQLGFVPFQAIARHVRGILNATALYRYAEARSGIKALQSYLDGEKGLECWNEEDHHALIKDDEVTWLSSEGPQAPLKTYDTSLTRTIITVFRLFGDVLRIGELKKKNIVKVDYSSWKVGTFRRPENVWIVSKNQTINLRRDPEQARNIIRSLLYVLFYFFIKPSRKPETLLKLATPTWWKKRLGIFTD